MSPFLDEASISAGLSPPMKNFLKNRSMEITPVDIAASAILKTGLKNVKGLLPSLGTHDGHTPSTMGKYNMSTTFPCKNGA